MGLEERRKLKTFQDEQYPELKAEIDEAATFEVDIDVDWDSISEMDGMKMDLWDEAWTKIYFRPLADAFDAITIDDIGREALEANLQSVVVTNEEGNKYASDVASFEDGVLTIDHKPNINVRDVDERAEAIVSELEASL